MGPSPRLLYVPPTIGYKPEKSNKWAAVPLADLTATEKAIFNFPDLYYAIQKWRGGQECVQKYMDTDFVHVLNPVLQENATPESEVPFTLHILTSPSPIECWSSVNDMCTLTLLSDVVLCRNHG
ncbi:hypothetical protein BCR44DRAFT_44482 [Catenaria anguillulae PL171]|uniref:Uncharacterized protein n=1 Tax=Catenaria anguillulae PL171 TaxID=765915 RepID=A0A1Y2H5M5_9FUNG|nr:hypothetical protein BCR44DRAFT_44482 [Catenaria anguillulae PL171]